MTPALGAMRRDGNVVVTGDVLDGEPLDLAALRDLCVVWGGDMDTLCGVGSILSSPTGTKGMVVVDPDTEYYTLTLTSEQWVALVKAARSHTHTEPLEYRPDASEDTPEERMWDVAEHILELQRALGAADAVALPDPPALIVVAVQP